MNTTKNLYQWDINQRLIDVAGKYVDFPNDYRVEVIDGECKIPDEVLQNSGKITAYECMADGTLREFVFDVTERPQPPDYVYTPTEKLTFDGLVQKVDDAVADMENRAAAGEFDGADGYTPVKGKDYFTESEIRQIQNEVSEGAIGDFKQTVDAETDKFDANAESKLSAYNQNDSQKTSAYNQNAQDKLASYNQNATDKTADYNANADSRLSEYNTNVDNKVAEFNLETGKIQTSIKDLSQLKPSETPTVGKVLKVLSINENGTFTCDWADDESGAVDDVQINGTSIVADGVANIPIAGASKVGLVKISTSNNSGIFLGADGNVQIDPANDTQISARLSISRPINPSHLDYAVKAAMCDGKGAEWTAEEQAMARERIGEPQYELIEEIVLTEDVKTIVRKSEPSGNLYSFKSILIDLEIPANVSHSNTYWRIKSNGVIVAYPNRPIASKAYTSYFQCGAERNNGFLRGWSNVSSMKEVSSGVVSYLYFNKGIVTDSPITEIEIASADTFVIGEIIRIYAIRG